MRDQGKNGRGRSKSQSRSASGRLSLRKIPWALVRIYIYFGVALVFFFALFAQDFFFKSVMEPFTAFVAFCSSKLLNVFGSWTSVSGTHLSSSDYGINVVYGCNGAFATAILLSGIIAYPSRIREKLVGVLIGIPAIFAINQVRVISLFLLGRSHPDVFEEAHVYVWQPIIIIFAIFVWDFWARNFVRKGKVHKDAVSG